MNYRIIFSSRVSLEYFRTIAFELKMVQIRTSQLNITFKLIGTFAMVN